MELSTYTVLSSPVAGSMILATETIYLILLVHRLKLILAMAKRHRWCQHNSERISQTPRQHDNWWDGEYRWKR